MLASEEQRIRANVAYAQAQGDKTEPCFSCGNETTMLAYVLGSEGRYYDREGWTVPACCPREACLDKHGIDVYIPPRTSPVRTT
jgi:hypothetical protein